MVAHLTSSATRSDIYAWYSLMGTAGAAFGMMTCGWVVHALTNNMDWTFAEACGAVFMGYAAVGILKFVLALMLSSKVEAEKKAAPAPTSRAAQQQDETTPLLLNPGDTPTQSRSRLRALLPEISKESRLIMTSLCVLFALDAFASGLASL